MSEDLDYDHGFAMSQLWKGEGFGESIFLSGSQMFSCIKWKSKLEIYRHECKFMSSISESMCDYEIHQILGFILD